MQKAYSRINWENYPSEATPLNESNLNRIDYALDEIDNRVITLDTTKLGVQDANTMITGVEFNNSTGVITITKYNGTTVTIQTNLAKIVLGWRYDYDTQKLILTQSDGTEVRIDLSSLIQNNEFYESTTIAFQVGQNGMVTADVKLHSISDDHLRVDYLADIRVAMENAARSEADAEASAILSNSWARGGTQTRTGEDENNSMYFAQQSESSKIAAEQAKQDAQDLVNAAVARLTNLTVQVNLTDGCLYYDAPLGVILQVDQTTGNLLYDISAA